MEHIFQSEHDSCYLHEGDGATTSIILHKYVNVAIGRLLPSGTRAIEPCLYDWLASKILPYTGNYVLDVLAYHICAMLFQRAIYGLIFEPPKIGRATLSALLVPILMMTSIDSKKKDINV